jgi:AcrR family transcriptional regulator
MDKVVTDRKELLKKFRADGILEAAIRVIAERGLEKATMEQVAEEAGISKATIYLYFRNKDDLYFHCVVDRFDRILTQLKEAVAGIDDPISRLEAIISVQTRAIESQRDFFRIFFTEKVGLFHDQSTELGREFDKRQREFAGLYMGPIKEGMDRGLLRRMDPVKAFYLLFSMVRGLAVHRVVRGDETPLMDDTGTILDVFLTGLKTV